MKDKKSIAISILDAKNKQEVLEKISLANKQIENIDIEERFYNIVHLDVMDNRFVPNSGVELDCIFNVKKHNLFADVHLMVEKPLEEGFIDKAIEYGADSITIHYEIENFFDTIKYLNSQSVEVGVAIKPDTDIKCLKPYYEYFDKILIMTVEPGYGGQKYMEKCNAKIIEANATFEGKKIEIDGGVNEETIKFGIQNNVSTFVLGNAIINSKNYYNSLLKFNIIKGIEELEKKLNNNTSIADIRKLAIKYTKIGCNFEVINFFLLSKYESYRSFINFVLAEIIEQNKNDEKKLNLIKDNLLKK